MNQKSIRRTHGTKSAQRDVYERLSKRLDELTERERWRNNAEKIAALRNAFFADIDELQKSGKVKLPKS